MRKVILFVIIELFAFQIKAQEYDSYLKKAYSALEEGNTEVAQSYYNVYKRMTDKTDPDFEVLLNNNFGSDWKSNCYIIKLNDSINIAVQHIDDQNPASWNTANKLANASRLGGFTDWRLANRDECYIVLPNIPIKENLFVWTSNCLYENKGYKVLTQPGFVITGTLESGYLADYDEKSKSKGIYLIIRTYSSYTGKGIKTNQAPSYSIGKSQIQ